MKRLILGLILTAFTAVAAQAQLMPNAIMQFLDNNGKVCNACVLYTYQGGTSTPLATYSDAALTVSNGTSITMSAAGVPQVGAAEVMIYLKPQAYKFVLKTAAGATLHTRDNVTDVASLLQADLSSSSASYGSAMVTYKRVATGATARTVRAKLDEIVSVLDFGADPTGVLDATAAVHNARDYLVTLGGGTLYFPSGTYKGNFNFANLGLTPMILRGDNTLSTILTATTGIVLDISSTSRMTVQDLTIYPNGADIGILAARYTTHSGWGSFHWIKRVQVKGAPAITGIFHIGAEESLYDQLDVICSGSAPGMIITTINVYGVGDTVYTSPNGTITGTSAAPESQALGKFLSCRFVKNNSGGITDTGPALEIGPNVWDMEFDQCYFNAANSYGAVEFNWHNTVYPITGVAFRGSDWEANGNSAVTATGSFGIRSVGNGAGAVNNLLIDNCFFNMHRYAANTYDIDFATVARTLSDSRIVGSRTGDSGGLNLGNVTNSQIEWTPRNDVVRVGTISAGATTFSMLSTLYVQANDIVLVGQSKRYDAEAGTFNPIEQRTVKSVSAPSGGYVTVTVTAGFTYDHYVGEYLYYGLAKIVSAQQSRFRLISKPVLTYDYGNIFEIGAVDQDQRIYYGPANTGVLSKQAPMIVNQPFRNEPNYAPTGSFATMRQSYDWSSTTTAVDSWTHAPIPVWYDGSQWYGMPLASRVSSGTLSLGTIADQAIATTTIDLSSASLGIAVGDFVLIAPTAGTFTGCTFSAWVTSTNHVTIVVSNVSGSPVVTGSSIFNIMIIKP